jgi:hypothetical protein
MLDVRNGAAPGPPDRARLVTERVDAYDALVQQLLVAPAAWT